MENMGDATSVGCYIFQLLEESYCDSKMCMTEIIQGIYMVSAESTQLNKLQYCQLSKSSDFLSQIWLPRHV